MNANRWLSTYLVSISMSMEANQDSKLDIFSPQPIHYLFLLQLYSFFILSLSYTHSLSPSLLLSQSNILTLTFSLSLSLSHSLTDPYSIYLSSFFYLHFCLCLLPTDRGMVPLFPLNHTHTHCHSFSMSKTSFLFIWFSFSYVSILQILSYFVGSLQTLLTASFKLRLTRFTQRKSIFSIIIGPWFQLRTVLHHSFLNLLCYLYVYPSSF